MAMIFICKITVCLHRVWQATMGEISFFEMFLIC
jgi:hypothetical protein